MRGNKPALKGPLGSGTFSATPGRAGVRPRIVVVWRGSSVAGGAMGNAGYAGQGVANIRGDRCHQPTAVGSMRAAGGAGTHRQLRPRSSRHMGKPLGRGAFADETVGWWCWSAVMCAPVPDVVSVFVHSIPQDFNS